MMVNPVLALVANGRLTEIDLKTLKDQELFPYNYDKGKIMVLPAEPPLVRCSASGAKKREGGQLEVKPRYQEEPPITSRLWSTPS